MTWAGRRRALIITIATIIAFAILAIVAFSIFYDVPTCTDRKQNQDEQGVDCGGSCTTLCISQVGTAPIVRFARALTPQPGRTDVIAYIDNPNGDAEARGAIFLLEVYGMNRELIAKKQLPIDLPASMTVPVYAADVAPRGSVASQAFLSFVPDATRWTRVEEGRTVPPVVEDITINETDRPRVTASLRNPLARPMYKVSLIATVFDAQGNAIAASQTLVTTLPSQGASPLVFTWNAPFSAPVSRVEILPVPMLSSRAP